MFSDTHSHHRTHSGAVLSKDYIRHLTVGAALSLPALIVVFELMDHRVSWSMPGVWTMAMMLIALCDFVAVVGLEPFRRKLGDLTLPMLLLTVGMMLLFVLTYGVNRFVAHIGFGWLYPAVLVLLASFALAVFMERNNVLKAALAGNAIALAILWNLAYSDKLVLPF
ncbi:MAG: hypothetical protein ACAH80_07220 [Alphaproteobacteria bacterium]